MPSDVERSVMPDNSIVVKSQQEIAGAGTPTAQLVAEMVARLETTEEVAKELEREITPSEQIPEAQKDNSKLILENIAKTLKVASMATPGQIPADSLNMLQDLSAELGTNISQKTAIRLHGLVKYALSNAVTVVKLEEHYKAIKDSGDTELVPKLSRVFIRTATSRLGISIDEAKKKFDPDLPSQSPAALGSQPHARGRFIENLRTRREKIDWTNLATNQPDYDAVKIFMQDPHRFTGDLDRVVAALAAHGFGSDSNARTFIADMRSVTEEQWEEYAMEVLRDQMSLDEEEKKILDKYFTKEERFFTDEFFTVNAAGEFVFKSDKVSDYKLGVLRIFNKLYQRVDQQPDRLFREEFNDFHEGLVFRILKRQLEGLSNKHNMRQVSVTYIHPDTGLPTKGTFRDFMNNFVSEINAENTWRETYHDMWIYAKDTSNLEKLPSFLSRLPASQVNIFLSGPGGELVETARAAFERYLSYDIAINDNKARPELLSGMFDPASQTYQLEDYNNIKEYFLGMLEARGINPADQKYAWQIERALTMARGIALINTLRVPEIIASATPEGGYSGNFLYDLAAYVNPQWSWSWGRGGPATAHGLELPVLRLIDIPILPEKSLWKRIFGLAGKFVPNEVHEKLEGKLEDKTEEYGAAWLDRQHEYGKLLRIFGIGGAHTRASWRYTGLSELRKDPLVLNMVNTVRNNAGLPPLLPADILKKDFDTEWYDNYLIRTIGAAEGWYFAGHRTQHELKVLFGKALHHHGHIKEPWDHLSEEEQNRHWEEFTSGEKDIDIHAFDRKQSLWQIAELREMQHRGDTFYNLLKRSPLDFMINITQLVPEVEGIEKSVEHIPGGQMVPQLVDLDGFNYWFIDDISRLQKPQDRANVKRFQQRMREKWGDNYDDIRRAAQMWTEVRDRFTTNVAGLPADPEQRHKEISKQFRNVMSAATERVRQRQDVAMRPDDIQIPGNPALETQLRDLMFGADGFVTYYSAAGDDHHQKMFTGTEEQRLSREIDEKNFFFRLANVWFREDQVGVFPTSAEVDHRLLFKYINRAGDNMNTRLVKDWPSWKAAMEGVLKLDEMLLHAANSHDLKDIMELHGKLNAIKYIQGERYMHQANYYIAALVGRFFQEHYAARLPFGLGVLGGFAMGEEISLSKLSQAGKTAMTMNSDQLSSYFQTLGKLGYIAPKDGPWSVDQLSKAIGVDFAKVAITEIIPNFLVFFALYLFWRWLKEAEEDAQGGGKGGGGGGGHH